MCDHVWWKHLHWFEYGAELVGTAFLLFAGVSAVVFDFGAGSPLASVVPDKSVRLLITGLLFAGSSSLVAISPLGKLSGGHINPAVTLAFWAQGKMHHFDLGGVHTWTVSWCDHRHAASGTRLAGTGCQCR